jgi:hypothetical protein
MIPTRDRYESVYYYWLYATQDKLSSLRFEWEEHRAGTRREERGHAGVMCTGRADDHGRGLKSAMPNKFGSDYSSAEVARCCRLVFHELPTPPLRIATLLKERCDQRDPSDAHRELCTSATLATRRS